MCLFGEKPVHSLHGIPIQLSSCPDFSLKNPSRLFGPPICRRFLAGQRIRIAPPQCHGGKILLIEYAGLNCNRRFAHIELFYYIIIIEEDDKRFACATLGRTK